MSRPSGKTDPALGRAIREIRTEKQLTRETVAHLAVVSINTIASIEQGHSNPTWMTVRQITEALGVTMGQLIARIES